MHSRDKTCLWSSFYGPELAILDKLAIELRSLYSRIEAEVPTTTTGSCRSLRCCIVSFLAALQFAVPLLYLLSATFLAELPALKQLTHEGHTARLLQKVLRIFSRASRFSLTLVSALPNPALRPTPYFSVLHDKSSPWVLKNRHRIGRLVANGTSDALIQVMWRF